MWFILLFSIFISVHSFSFSALSGSANDTECPIVPLSAVNLPREFKVAQYNVEWFFLKQYESCPGSGCSWETIEDAEIHLSHLADVVRKINPDILNLCEVEGCYELGQLSSSLVDSNFQPYLLFGTDTATGQNVGMLTKYTPSANLKRVTNKWSYPLPGSACGYNKTGTTGVSKHYYTWFELPDNQGKMYMISAHLLAIPTDPQRCAERESQAQVLQELIVNITKTEPDAHILLLGDLNDYDGVVGDINNNQPVSRVLEILKGNVGVYSGEYQLFPVSAEIPVEERYTNWWDPDSNCIATMNEMSMIDHILVDEWLRERITHVEIPHLYPEYCGTYDSDHYPVVVTFNV